MDKGDPPNPSRLVPNGQGFDPPNLSRLGAAPQMDKGLNPPTLHDFGAAPKWTRVWPPPTLHDLEGFSNGQGFDPPTLHDLEWLPNGQGLDPPQSDWTPQPFTTWRVWKLTASVTKFCLYDVPFALRCRPISRFPYFASSREGVALSKCLSES